LPAVECEPLGEDITADVCVIGAGISGLLVAERLLKEGHAVRVLDRAGLAAGETGRTTAHLSAVLDTGYRKLQSMHGESAAHLIADSHAAAITYIETLAQRHGIDCDFRRLDGFLYSTAGRRGATLDELDSERLAATRAGLNVKLVERAPLPYPTGAALRFADQADFHPTKLLGGVARAIIAGGGRIHAPVRVLGIETKPELCVRTELGPVVHARHVVVASNTPINDVVTLHTKQAPYRTYALAVPVVRGSVAPGLYWDLDEPYHYLRTVPNSLSGDDNELLVAGGEDHKVGQDVEAQQPWARLDQWLRQRIPGAGAVLFRWSGQVLEPADGIGFIGRNPGDDDVYVVTGHSGNGMTYGALGAILIPDLIAGKQNPWARLYDPARKPRALEAIGTYARENLNVARHYGDWLSNGTAESIDQIPRGEGAVIRRGLRKVAVYVDEQGHPHARNARCTHLGCVVVWNRAEKSWDCPCHGSRFNRYGNVIVGPAVRDLQSIDEDSATPPPEQPRR
jgi:glycine/D-amino acid oxidase-like deaminating enzyme/nitrite reductase/ring-hydroxylating ferredoxin subunit